MYDPRKMSPRQAFYIASMADVGRFSWGIPDPKTLLEVLLHFREQKKYLPHEFAILPGQLQALITPMDATTAENGGQAYPQ